MKTFDFVVLGSGSAGFNAARTAQARGLKTAIVDGAKDLGGLCILRGCMPSKTLLYMTDVLHLAQHGQTFGLRIPHAQPDMRAMHRRKVRIINEFAADRLKALESGKYTILRSNARFLDAHTLELDDGTRIGARHTLIGTGSKVSFPDVPGLRDVNAWTSDDVLDLNFIPESAIMLGGGIVACELAQFLARIGTRVTIIQRGPKLLRSHSPEASDALAAAFKREGIQVFMGTKISRVRKQGDGVRVEFQHEGKMISRGADHLINALGREPNTGKLNLDAAGVKTRDNGQIVANRWQQTSVPHIYAAGDCCGPHEIVHIAVQQGEIAAKHASGAKEIIPVDSRLLLNVVFTSPGVATIGYTPKTMDELGLKFLASSYPFNDHGKSILMEETCGFVRIFAEPKRGVILGAEVVGPHAGELIHIFSGPLKMKATVFDLLHSPWYHPTLSEIMTYPLEELCEKIAK